MTRKPRSHVRILVYRTWACYCLRLLSLIDLIVTHVRGAGTRDKALGTSAWEAKMCLPVQLSVFVHFSWSQWCRPR